MFGAARLNTISRRVVQSAPPIRRISPLVTTGNGTIDIVSGTNRLFVLHRFRGTGTPTLGGNPLTQAVNNIWYLLEASIPVGPTATLTTDPGFVANLGRSRWYENIDQSAPVAETFGAGNISNGSNWAYTGLPPSRLTVGRAAGRQSGTWQWNISGSPVSLIEISAPTWTEAGSPWKGMMVDSIAGTTADVVEYPQDQAADGNHQLQASTNINNPSAGHVAFRGVT